MTYVRMLAFALSSIIAMPALAASEDDVILASKHLRCAAFYVAGSTTVSKPEVKQELQERANRSLYSAELLLDRDRPLVKAEFETARKKFFEEIASPEVKADPRGFLKFMGGNCNDLQAKNPAQGNIPSTAAPKTATPVTTPNTPSSQTTLP